MSERKIIIGSRGSKLALVQANMVKSLLYKYQPDIRIDVKIIKTKGDFIKDAPLAKVGDKGLFTKEIEDALLDDTIDLAVHSMKDLPTKLPYGLVIGAVLEREDPRDAFISHKYDKFSQLPEGAIVATSSLRRRANILIHRPDIQQVDIRGNVDTRLRKLKENNYDGLILAVAGLVRLGYQDVITEIIEPEWMLPAIAQGALGIEIRENNKKINELIEPLHDADTWFSVQAERAFLHELEGGCQVPIGALAVMKKRKVMLQGIVSDLDGKEHYRDQIEGNPGDAEELGILLARKLLDQGAQKILEAIYSENRT